MTVCIAYIDTVQKETTWLESIRLFKKYVIIDARAKRVLRKTAVLIVNSFQGQIEEFLKEGVYMVADIYSITNFLFSNKII